MWLKHSDRILLQVAAELHMLGDHARCGRCLCFAFHNFLMSGNMLEARALLRTGNDIGASLYIGGIGMDLGTVCIECVAAGSREHGTLVQA